MLIYQCLSNYKTHTFSNARYLAPARPAVFQGKMDENQNSEAIVRFEVVEFVHRH